MGLVCSGPGVLKATLREPPTRICDLAATADEHYKPRASTAQGICQAKCDIVLIKSRPAECACSVPVSKMINLLNDSF